MTTSAPPATPSTRGPRFACTAGTRPAPRPRAGALLLALALCVPLLAAACGGGGTPAPVYQDGSPEAQMDFGVQMAQRGLWNEALFRFQRARNLSPGNPRVLNNLAVAYEATGQFDEALTAYQQALQASPENRELRRNYARFVEFYQAYRPADEVAGEGGDEAATETSAAAGNGSAGGESPSLSMPAPLARVER